MSGIRPILIYAPISEASICRPINVAIVVCSSGDDDDGRHLHRSRQPLPRTVGDGCDKTDEGCFPGWRATANDI